MFMVAKQPMICSSDMATERYQNVQDYQTALPTLLPSARASCSERLGHGGVSTPSPGVDR
jgi:hypothetical protein